MSPTLDLSSALALRIANRTVTEVRIANRTVFPLSTGPAPWTTVWAYGGEAGETARDFSIGGYWGTSTTRPRTGVNSLYWGVTTGDQARSYSQTGLTIGKRYRLSVWMCNFPNPDYIATSFSISVPGIGSSGPIALPGYANGTAWVQGSYEFVATATTHTLTLSVLAPGNNAMFTDDMLFEVQG